MGKQIELLSVTDSQTAHLNNSEMAKATGVLFSM